MANVEATAARAFDLQANVLAKLAAARHQWVPLAAALHTFHAEQGWRHLGLQSFSEWLAQPEVGMSYRSAKDAIDAYGSLVLARGIAPEVLADTDPSKIAVVLPAIRNGSVPVDQALADCQTLARRDLRDHYRSPNAGLDATREPAFCTCPDCGTTHKRKAA